MKFLVDVIKTLIKFIVNLFVRFQAIYFKVINFVNLNLTFHFQEIIFNCLNYFNLTLPDPFNPLFFLIKLLNLQVYFCIIISHDSILQYLTYIFHQQFLRIYSAHFYDLIPTLIIFFIIIQNLF